MKIEFRTHVQSAQNEPKGHAVKFMAEYLPKSTYSEEGVLVRTVYGNRDEDDYRYIPVRLSSPNFLTYVNELSELSEYINDGLKCNDKSIHFISENEEGIELIIDTQDGKFLIDMSEEDEWCDSCRVGDRHHIELSLDMSKAIELRKQLSKFIDGDK